MKVRRAQLIVKREVCSGCRTCEVVCSLRHEGKVWPTKSRIKVTKIEAAGVDYPVVCRQCGNAPCINACNVGALTRNENTGAIVVGQGCDGCGSCVKACPFGAITLDLESNMPLICDLCSGEPACVQRCVVQALKYRSISGRVVSAGVNAATLPLRRRQATDD